MTTHLVMRLTLDLFGNNLIVISDKQTKKVKVLSATVEGKKHDKALADETGYKRERVYLHLQLLSKPMIAISFSMHVKGFFLYA